MLYTCVRLGRAICGSIDYHQLKVGKRILFILTTLALDLGLLPSGRVAGARLLCMCVELGSSLRRFENRGRCAFVLLRNKGNEARYNMSLRAHNEESDET